MTDHTPIQRLYESPDPRLSRLLQSGSFIFYLPGSYIALSITSYNNQEYASITDFSYAFPEHQPILLHHAYHWSQSMCLTGLITISTDINDITHFSTLSLEATPLAIIFTLTPQKGAPNDNPVTEPASQPTADQPTDTPSNPPPPTDLKPVPPPKKEKHPSPK